MNEVEKILFELKDEKYSEFQRKLVPNIPGESIIGVRTPALRALAKQIAKESWCDDFLKELPHKYYEENQLHSFIISGYKDWEKCVSAFEEFLPYINNWAVCDQGSPKIFKKHTSELLPYIEKWLKSGKTYTMRFGVGILMGFYLEEAFQPDQLEKVASCCQGDEKNYDSYYINMMIAWYLATALAKQWDSAIKILEEKKLSAWVHNKTIQKARESFRITEEQKEYLKTLKLQ